MFNPSCSSRLFPKEFTTISEDSHGWNTANCAVKFTQQPTEQQSWGQQRCKVPFPYGNRACAQEIKDRVSTAAYKSQGTLKSNGYNKAEEEHPAEDLINSTILQYGHKLPNPSNNQPLSHTLYIQCPLPHSYTKYLSFPAQNKALSA